MRLGFGHRAQCARREGKNGGAGLVWIFARTVAWRRQKKVAQGVSKANQSGEFQNWGGRKSARFGGHRPPLQGGALRAGFEAVADPIGEAAEEFGGESGGPGGIDAGGAEGGLNHGKGLEGFKGTEGGLGGLAVVPELEEVLGG